MMDRWMHVFIVLVVSISPAPGFRPHNAGSHEPRPPAAGAEDRSSSKQQQQQQRGSSRRVAGLVYNATHLLDGLLQSYDSRLRPDFGGPPTVVDVNLNIRSMGPISERDMAYQMDCYFRQSWVDKRLKFTGGLKTLPVTINVLDRLWKPDTHFFNGMRSYLHTVTSPNKLLRINQDGRILYSMRLTIKASCPMHLEKFPMDTQLCPLRFGSHGYTSAEVVYHWTHGVNHSIKMASDMALSQFDLIGFPAGNETDSKPHRGPYSVLFVKFHLRRHMGYFLINVYVPCALLVIISWVGFWINREATSDRVALAITTVLTMAFLRIDNRRDLPEVSYSTALDYFLGTCFGFILATIIQFAGVHYFTKNGSGEIIHDSDSEEEDFDDEEEIITCSSKVPLSNGQQNATTKPFARQNGRLPGSGIPGKQDNQRDNRPDNKNKVVARDNCCLKFLYCVVGSSTYRRLHRQNTRFKSMNSVSVIDRVSRFCFPVLFVAFNLFYWIVYLEAGDVMLM